MLYSVLKNEVSRRFECRRGSCRVIIYLERMQLLPGPLSISIRSLALSPTCDLGVTFSRPRYLNVNTRLIRPIEAVVNLPKD